MNKEKDLSNLLEELKILNLAFLDDSKKVTNEKIERNKLNPKNALDSLKKGYLKEIDPENHPFSDYKLTQKGIEYLEDITSIINFSLYGE